MTGTIAKRRVESPLFSIGSFVQPSLRERLQCREIDLKAAFSPVEPDKSPLFMERAAHVLGIPPSLIRIRKGVDYRPSSSDLEARKQLCARQACAYVMSKTGKYEIGAIGNALGMRHSAVKVMLSRVERKIASDAELASMVDALEVVA
ncbi:hypothetical protein [Sphingorhabdus sp. SMR4y]|uniref:hypothetical protein n=1 Tax=Sphingorhabdus sp. SMR4y TaxID=2584094 RepID=UPI000B5C39D7|nr:hypothetical protein [Sphingorhabdus sp. SMR4y]ASK88484.1 hypothetical protein SPHFLASMR4Y_01737 [Sphingorhabdus sp. SMR4y]